jgi:hypothetical protein
MTRKSFAPLIATIFLAACASVNQADLQAWKGVSVTELDTHPYFARLHVARNFKPEGLEVRTLTDSFGYSQCTGYGTSTPVGPAVVGTSTVRCNSRVVACDHVFFILNDRITEYNPVGACHTDESMRPRLIKPNS